MSDRILAQVTEHDEDLDIAYRLTVQRSAAGAPGGFVTIERSEAGNDEDSLTVAVPDLSVFAAAVEWARG